MKKLLVVLLSFFTLFGTTHADAVTERITTILDEAIEEIALPQNDTITIDLFEAQNTFNNLFDNGFSFAWKQWETVLSRNPRFIRTFTEAGLVNISLDVLRFNTPILTYNFDILPYKMSIPTLIEDDSSAFLHEAKDEGVHLSKLFAENALLPQLETYRKTTKGTISDYILIVGGRDFAFSILSKLNFEQPNKLLNIILLTDENIDIYPQLFSNFLTGKNWIDNFITIDTRSSNRLLEYTKITEFLTDIETKKYPYHAINSADQSISKWLFISRFVNTLSNKGLTTQNIYILLLIPFLISLVVFFKHFVGITPIGIMLPVFLTIMSLQETTGILILILAVFILVNIIIAQILNRYSFLYTPKIAFLLVIHIVVFMWIQTLLESYGFEAVHAEDVLYYIVFIFLLEKTISMIWSKAFGEYSYALLYTVFFVAITWGIINIPIVQTALLSYPEMIILLIPFNYFFARYSGLRLTEYLRFSEVIKNIEE